MATTTKTAVARFAVVPVDFSQSESDMSQYFPLVGRLCELCKRYLAPGSGMPFVVACAWCNEPNQLSGSINGRYKLQVDQEKKPSRALCQHHRVVHIISQKCIRAVRVGWCSVIDGNGKGPGRLGNYKHVGDHFVPGKGRHMSAETTISVANRCQVGLVDSCVPSKWF